VRLINGRYRCALCEAVLDIPADSRPVVVIVAASGEPNLRTIRVDGEEVHRCAFRHGGSGERVTRVAGQQ